MQNKCRFLIAVMLVASCIPIDSIDVFWSMIRYGQSTLDVQYFWLNSIIYGGIFGGYFINVLAALPCGDSFCREYEEGIWRYLIAREGTKKYSRRKIEKVFFSGGFVSACGSGLIIAFLCCRLPLFSETRSLEVEFLPFSNFLTDKPILYFEIVLYLMFLSGGFWTLVSFCFSAYAPVPYLVYLFPFVASFFLTRVNTMLHIPGQLRLDYLLRGRMGPSSYIVYLVVVTVEIIVLSFLCSVLFYKKLKWRISNE